MRVGTAGILPVIFALSVGAFPLGAQTTPPTTAKNAVVTELTGMDLAPEIAGLKDRHLRTAMVTVLPGGFTASHSHADRPESVYVLLGTASVHVKEGNEFVIKQYTQGQAFTAGKETFHWFENAGKMPLVMVFSQLVNTATATDLPPEAKR